MASGARPEGARPGQGPQQGAGLHRAAAAVLQQEPRSTREGARDGRRARVPVAGRAGETAAAVWAREDADHSCCKTEKELHGALAGDEKEEVRKRSIGDGLAQRRA